MAQGKKTFIFYSDWINMVREMPDADAGMLLKHVLSYVNDEDPKTDNLLVRMAFGHMKPMLKSDLDKWEKQLKKFSEMGKNSAKKRALAQVQHKSTQVERTSTVNDNVNVNVNNIYSESDFLKDWCKIRTHFMKKPTHITKLETFELVDFNTALKHFDKKQIQDAMLGLFKQENKNITSMYLKPKHFLENVSKYLNAELGKDYQLYGKEVKKEKTGGL